MNKGNVIYLDTETTGVGKQDRIIQLAFIVDVSGELALFDDFCNSGQEISCEAMMTHHITPDMIADKPKITETIAWKTLQELNTPDNYLVIHNAPFDIGMLEKEGFINKMKIIDTLKVARKLTIDTPSVSMHKLVYLVYRLHLWEKVAEIATSLKIEGNAHNAAYDVAELYALTQRFGKTYTIDNLFEITQGAMEDVVLGFGKYIGQKVSDVYKRDKGYLEWCLNKMEFKDASVKEAIQYQFNKKNDKRNLKKLRT